MERPILFSGPMVRAILKGRKTQTRRVVSKKHFPFLSKILNSFLDGKWNQRPLPYGKPGDRLWVRETFSFPETILKAPNYLRMADGETVVYRADIETPPPGYSGWKPSIHMPRQFSRINLEVVNVSIQRLNEITDEECRAEGCTIGRSRTEFIELWDSINAARGYCWENNPWVWAITFKKV